MKLGMFTDPRGATILFGQKQSKEEVIQYHMPKLPKF